MWYLLAMFLVRGGTMSEQHPTASLPALPPETAFPPRTIEDVERELHLANALIVERRARQGDKAKFLERIDGKPALLVQEINWLHEEWAVMRGPRST